jgi:hypothetical protein
VRVVWIEFDGKCVTVCNGRGDVKLWEHAPTTRRGLLEWLSLFDMKLMPGTHLLYVIKVGF